MEIVFMLFVGLIFSVIGLALIANAAQSLQSSAEQYKKMKRNNK